MANLSVNYINSVNIWLPSGILKKDLLDSSLYPPQYEYTVTGKTRKKAGKKMKTGKKIQLNGISIALFRYKNLLFAVDSTCPHQGGPLELGDIEDINGDICVSCPWHNWLFRLTDGKSLISEKYKTMQYPTKLSSKDEILIGFEKISNSLFHDDDF